MSYLRVRQILTTVAGFYGLTEKQIRSHRRFKAISWPRQVAMFFCRQRTDASYPSIASDFGGFDHTTAIAACKRVQWKMEDSDAIRDEVAAVGALLDTVGLTIPPPRMLPRDPFVAACEAAGIRQSSSYSVTDRQVDQRAESTTTNQTSPAARDVSFPGRARASMGARKDRQIDAPPSLMSRPASAEVPTAMSCESTRTPGRVAAPMSPAPSRISSAQGECSAAAGFGGAFDGGSDAG